MKISPFVIHFQAMAQQGGRSRTVRRCGLLALATATLLLASCGGGGGSSPPPSEGALVWDNAQATWDRVNWQ